MKQHARPRDLSSGKPQNDVDTQQSASDDLYARVAVLAYAFYEQRGRQDGHHIEDWIQAENSIREEVALTQNGVRTRNTL